MWGLIFDVDGVIADTEGYNAEAAAAAFSDVHGVEIPPETFYHFAGTGEHAYFTGAGRVHGLTVLDIEALMASWQNHYWLLVEELGSPSAPPGLHDLLGAAHTDDGVRVGIATSGQPEKQLRIIAEAGVDVKQFDIVLTGADVARKKPDPEIYLLAAERLDLPAWRCVVIEDTKVGIDAANAADMRCVALASTAGIYELYAADRMLQSLEDTSLDELKMIATASVARTGH